MSTLDTDCQSGRRHVHRLANTDLKTNQFLWYCNNVPQYLSWVWNFLQTSTCSGPADRPRRVIQIKFALYSSLWFLSLWMNTYWLCRPPVCEAEMTYDRVSISFLHLQPQLISSHSVDLLEIKQAWPWLCVRLVWKGGEVTEYDFGDLFWWHSSWDLSSYASLPNGITRFSLPVYLPTLLSATWEAQTTPHQETNDNCQRLSRKTQVREMDWHLSPH